MTDSEILARWQGWTYDIEECLWIDPIKRDGWLTLRKLPDYPNDDAAAMGLLDTLVKKGYAVGIASRSHKRDIGIARNDCNLDYCISMVKPTRREAIIAACLELIEKEANNARS